MLEQHLLFSAAFTCCNASANTKHVAHKLITLHRHPYQGLADQREASKADRLDARVHTGLNCGEDHAVLLVLVRQLHRDCSSRITCLAHAVHSGQVASAERADHKGCRVSHQPRQHANVGTGVSLQCPELVDNAMHRTLRPCHRCPCGLDRGQHEQSSIRFEPHGKGS